MGPSPALGNALQMQSSGFRFDDVVLGVGQIRKSLFGQHSFNSSAGIESTLVRNIRLLQRFCALLQIDGWIWWVLMELKSAALVQVAR